MTQTNLHPLAVLGKADYPSGGLLGYVDTVYVELMLRLGPPHTHRGDKTTVEWAFHCADGTCFHVYDWKEPTTPRDLYAWHIGGNCPEGLAAFERFSGLKARPLDWQPAPLPDDLPDPDVLNAIADAAEQQGREQPEPAA